MPSCSRKEALAKFLLILVTNTIKLLFILVTNTIKFLFLFFYLFSIYFAKVFTFFFRYEDEYEDEVSYEDDDEDKDDDEKEEEEEYKHSQIEKEHLVADIVNDGDTLVFLPKDLQDVNKHIHIINNNYHVHSHSYESLFEDPMEEFDDETTVHFESSPITSKFEMGSKINNDDIISKINVGYEVISEDYTSRLESNNLCESPSELVEDHSQNNDYEGQPVFDDAPTKSQAFVKIKAYGPEINNGSIYHERDEKKMKAIQKDEEFTKEEKFLIFDPPKSEVKKLLQDLEKEEEGIFEDTYTVGSTSKSSSDWRSSIRDSAITDDPFSSSSRRSCPKWESYAVYQKYDEEMMFLDRISAQKLHETESMRSFQVEPRSISQRIVHKLGHKNKRNSAEDEIYSKKKKNNPYNELEVAYVAQICLAWEALNWNYATFQRKHGSKPVLHDDDDDDDDDNDDGCPAHIAQQFQQFEVLLQRYTENEPFQRGKRPEIYARMRADSPKLLQVPEYHDYEGEEREESEGRIGSAMFLKILEDAIQTFMNFLKADRETHCQLIIAILFKARPRGSIDPNIINVIKKQNNKMKLKLRDLQHTRTHICFKKRKISKETKMEILMGLIDLKIVSRVLRMADITPEQIQWCEAKMGKHRILDGILLRDSSPLFFPAH